MPIALSWAQYDYGSLIRIHFGPKTAEKKVPPFCARQMWPTIAGRPIWSNCYNRSRKGDVLKTSQELGKLPFTSYLESQV